MTLLGLTLLIWSWTTLLLQFGSTPVWVPLVIILIIILIFWWGITRNKIQDEDPAEENMHEDHAEEIAASPEQSSRTAVDEASEEIEEIVELTDVVEPAAPIEPDDLKLIEGIGPKISGVLAEAGIVTFAQLADSDPAELEKIVREDAGIRLANPSTWPHQARLAADGNWDELEQLQEELHAGQHKE